MAEKKDNKTVEALKETGFILVCFTCVVLIILAFFYMFDSSFRNRFSNKNPLSSSSQASLKSEEDQPDKIDFYFIDMGNGKKGDCIYIKAGEQDILIDSGNSTEVYSVIETIVDQHCTDKTLEYVIATNSTSSHISSFYVPSKDAIFSHYKIKTLIDFGDQCGDVNGQVVYNSYVTGRNMIIQRDKTHYIKAHEFFNDPSLSKSIQIGNKLSMEILPNKFYTSTTTSDNKTPTAKDYSVMVMFTQGETNKNHFLFTGEVSKENEDNLVTAYQDLYNTPLPVCQVYRANNYGDSTSSNTSLLKAINPTYCLLTCCAGENEDSQARPAYAYPSQSFINRISKYTSKVYAPSYIDTSKQIKKMNGNITVHSSSNLSLSLEFENNDSLLKDSVWFNQTGDLYTNSPNRTWPNN